MITILGPTASGKTALAAHLAYAHDGEVISADSRQVYHGMSVGTGKDLSEYMVNGKAVPYHLIDIVDPGYEYNIFEYQRDFLKAYNDITSRGKLPILCGGSGMYLESVLRKYRLKKTEPSQETREALSQKTDEELKDLLFSLKTPHNTTDLHERNRMIRAILISMTPDEKAGENVFPEQMPSFIFGIHWERTLLREKITNRLQTRLEHGMIEEVRELLNSGLTADQIKFYGLEYRYIMLYLEQQIDYNEMFKRLNIAIHQFAKRQMTWFRKMEKNGIPIFWLDGAASLEENLDKIRQKIFSITN
ncbi:MAG TPA: tRNA (adenosine(37)-N6)-dimethylallyltransferase MiaA [Bacteroidales bacterium]|nr:tRNA (adenosine(37)-N6)-dimethylallyltransferase MiaA [Bacteroidales bacterium]